MNTSILKKVLVTTYIIIILVTVGFNGILVFEQMLVDVGVDAISITVNDDGGADYTTIQDAIDNAGAGDTIYVWAGTYIENVIVSKSVTLIGNGSTNTTIDGGGTGDVIQITANWVNVTGFKIINSGKISPSTHDAGIELNNVQNVLILNNSCSNNNHGIYLVDSHFNNIMKNTFSLNIVQGIFLYNSNSNTLINNTSKFNGYQGTFLQYSNSNEIINNTCNSNNYIGIALDNSDNNIIVNNTSNENNRSGLRLNLSRRNSVINNICNSNIRMGIGLFDSNSNIVDNNNCSLNELCDIYLLDSQLNKIRHNICIINIEGSDILLYSIILYNSNSNSIENNICFSNNFCIRLDHSGSNTVANNTCISSMNREGITLWASQSNSILNNSMISCSLFIDGFQQHFWNTHTIDTSNTVNGKPVYYYIDKNEGAVPSDAGQVILANCINVKVENLEFSNINVPISLGFSFSNKIANNTLTNNSAGIYFHSSNFNNVTNNSCNLNDRFGINLEQSDQNKITKNNCSNNDENGFGIFLYSSDGNVLNDNICNSNRFDGIYLYESEDNIILHNIVSSNWRNGIFLNHFANNNAITNNEILFNNNHGIHISDCNYIDIYYNRFISNAVQAEVTGNSFDNQWDNDNGEGNYWNDYTGLDNGYNKRILGDGIGDTKIPHLGLDNYPFINPTGWHFPGLPALIDPGEFVPDGNYTVSWLANRGTTWYILEEDDNYEFDSPTVVYDGLELAIHFWYKPNGTYFYRLKAFSDHHESDWSNIVDITVDWPPDIPQNLMASVYPVGNSLNISWDLNSVDTKEYDIYNKTNNVWNILATLVHPEQTFNHTGLQDGKEYYYKIISRDFRGQESNFTEVISAIPADSMQPVAPTGLEVIETSFDFIKLRWEQNIEDDVMGYNIYRNPSPSPSDWGEPIVTTPLGNLTHTDSGLNETTTYYYVITAFDEVPFESNFSNQISGTTILGEHGPEINNSIGNFSIDEDCTDFSKIKLFHWFKDRNYDPLTFWCEGQANINVTIYQINGTVGLCPEPNWYGEETVTFFASDGVNECSDSVTITVSSVNDPPGPAKIKSPKKGVIINYGDTLDFKGECSDPDQQYGDQLTFNWTSDIYGEIGTGEQLRGIKLPAGKHLITLRVIDSEGKNSTAAINITVKKEVEGASSLLVPAISGVIIVIIFILILFVVLKRRKEVKKKETVAAQAQTYTVPSQQMLAPSKQPYAEMLARTQVPGQVEAPIGPMTSTVKPTIGQPTLQPQAQPSVPLVTTPQPSVTKKIEWGGAYIIITKAQDFGLNIFEESLGSSPERGLCITRTHPSILKKSPIMTGITKIWLSNTPGEDSVSPGNVTKLAHVINQFITTHSKAVILIDGLGFLINNNDFQRILKFLEMIHEMIVLNNGALLVPINPLTLSKIDFELLENELINTIKDPTYQPK